MRKVILILLFGLFISGCGCGCSYKIRFFPKYNYDSYKPKADVEQPEGKTRMSMSVWTGIPVAKWGKNKK